MKASEGPIYARTRAAFAYNPAHHGALGRFSIKIQLIGIDPTVIVRMMQTCLPQGLEPVLANSEANAIDCNSVRI